MSAVREVKYLRELHHPNVIEVCNAVHCVPLSTHSAHRIIIVESFWTCSPQRPI